MSVKVQFVLTGFTHDVGFRVFAFERIGEDRGRTKCTVRADLSLSQRYGVHIQELPLLCRALLEKHEESGDFRSLTFSEVEFRACSDERAAAHALALSKRRPPVRPAGENAGAAWRAQHP
jgi:hypothetical protein